MTRKQPLTPEESRAIKTLQKLARKWPKSLWLFSGAGTLHVMRAGADGLPVMDRHGGTDPDYSLATIEISNDGGDWS